MASLRQPLTEWIAAHPDYNKYQAAVAGKPVCIQHTPTVISATATTFDPADWDVVNVFSTFPELSMSATTETYRYTGDTVAHQVPTGFDPPDASDIEVTLGNNYADVEDTLEDISAASAASIAAIGINYCMNFMGTEVPSRVYACSFNYESGESGDAGSLMTTNISATPDPASFNKRLTYQST